MARRGAVGALTAAEQVAKARAMKKQEGLAIKVANVAAGALATLAKNNDCNQIMITEEGGIQPLVDLLKTPAARTSRRPRRCGTSRRPRTTSRRSPRRAASARSSPPHERERGDRAVRGGRAALTAREHTENQIAVAKAGAIAPLIDLLGSDSSETQEHSVGALLHLASQDVASRNAVVQRLVAVLACATRPRR